MFDRAAQIAKDCGVYSIMATGRRGLERPLRKLLKNMKIHRVTFKVEV